MTTIAIGDVVSLKLGGPPMTVENVHPEYVNVAWFDKNDVLRRDIFSPSHLQKQAVG